MKTDADLEALIDKLTKHYEHLLDDPSSGKRLHARAMPVAVAYERWLHGIGTDESITVDDVLNVSVSLAVTMMSRVMEPVLFSDPTLNRRQLVDSITEVIYSVLLDPTSVAPEDGSVAYFSAKAN